MNLLYSHQRVYFELANYIINAEIPIEMSSVNSWSGSRVKIPSNMVQGIIIRLSVKVHSQVTN